MAGHSRRDTGPTAPALRHRPYGTGDAAGEDVGARRGAPHQPPPVSALAVVDHDPQSDHPSGAVSRTWRVQTLIRAGTARCRARLPDPVGSAARTAERSGYRVQVD